MLRFRALAVAAALAAAPAAGADAAPWTWSSNGLAETRAHGGEDYATRLVPEPERIGPEPRFLSVTAVAGLEAWKGPVTVSGAGRLFARTAPREGDRAVRLHVDEIYAEHAATPEHFLFAGRRHIVHGRSLGVNPLDVAVDPRDLDRFKDTTRRRSEIEGQDMLGFESLLDDRFTLTGYWTPGERALLAGTLTLPRWKSDLTALLLDDERPGVGLSFSRNLGDAALVYGDAVVRRGRDRVAIRADRRSDAAPGTFFAEEGHDSRLFARASIGAGYTFDSGAGFNVEYHFDANGYSTGEWDEITGPDRRERHGPERGPFRGASRRQSPPAERAARSIHPEAALRLPQSAASRPVRPRSRGGDDHLPWSGRPQREHGTAPGMGDGSEPGARRGGASSVRRRFGRVRVAHREAVRFRLRHRPFLKRRDEGAAFPPDIGAPESRSTGAGGRPCPSPPGRSRRAASRARQFPSHDGGQAHAMTGGPDAQAAGGGAGISPRSQRLSST